MKSVTAAMAAVVGETLAPEPVTILIESAAELEQLLTTKETTSKMRGDALALFNALCKSLPQGTIDRLTALFVARMASSLIVRYESAKPETIAKG